MAQFDPSQFGATPVTMPAFNASQFGATPVSQNTSTNNPDGTINIPASFGGQGSGTTNPVNAQPANNPDGTINIPQSLMGQSPAPTGGITSNSTAGNVGLGLWQSLAGFAGGMAQNGQNISSAIKKFLTPSSGPQGSILSGLFPKEQQTNPITQKLDTFANSATGPAQLSGKIVGDIAQFLAVPENDLENIAADSIEKYGPKLEEAFGPDAGKALTNVLKFLGKSATSAGTAAGVTSVQSGGNLKQTILGGIAGLVSPAVAAGVEATGEGLAKMFIPKSDAEAGVLQAYKAGTSLVDRMKAVFGLGDKEAPSTAASTAFDKGIVGTESAMGVQAKRMQTSLWNNIISPALKSSDVMTDMGDFLDQAEKKITQETNDPTRLGVLKNALDSIKEDFAGIGKVSMEQLQKFKEGWAEFVPEKAYKGQPIVGALNDVRNTLAGMARSTIHDALGDNVKQAYLDYSNLYGLTSLGRKAMTGAIKGGSGTTLKALLEMATVPISTIGGQTVYKIGQLLDLVGPAGASIVKDIFNTPNDQSGTQNATTQSPSILSLGQQPTQ